MVRSIVAVIASYIAMAVLIMCLFMALWFGLGPNGLLKPGSFDGNLFFTIAAPAITVIVGLGGGWMCAKIARGTKPVIVLAVIVLVLGLTMTYFTLQKPEMTGVRDPAMTVQEIMKDGREPTWLAIFNPIAGALTVLIGGLCIAAPRKPS